MKKSKIMRYFTATILGAVLGLSALPAWGQTDETEEEQVVFELSPFEVSTSGDRGYFAANTISGSRISVPIQDIPLTIEVVTSEFIEDTGATDLRDSLKYSAGILLESQNDAFGLTDNVGQINNPEGATGNKSDSSFKIRGFVLENTLRNGYRRKNATDTVNIDRIEVIRGPSALLYGVGNFGGVVNYITKAPRLDEYSSQITLGYGSDNWKRSSLDTTGPIVKDHVGYRFTAAYEDKDDWTDLNTREHFFISPAVTWRFWDRIKLTVDYEYGKADEDAISFKSVRTPALENISIFFTDRLETFGFLEFSEDKNANGELDPGEDLNDNGQIDLTRDPRTFRWSGPDTYIDTTAQNFNASLEFKLADNLFYNGGINYSKVEFGFRDVFGGISRGTNGQRGLDILEEMQAAGRGFIARQIIDGQSSDQFVPVYDGVFRYQWNGSEEVTDWLQHRHELNFSKRIAEGNKWLASDHSFLLGYSMESQEFARTGYLSNNSEDDDNWMYQDPTDESYIRFGYQSNGIPDVPFLEYEVNGNTAENVGKYLVYSGRFFKDRLFLVAGIRDDKTTSKDGYYQRLNPKGRLRTFPDSTLRKRTKQFGASLEVLPGVTVFALSSEGVEPNFDGQRDGWGMALESTVAEAKEYGVKLNILDGRISGTISKFNIRREGLPFRYWWAPAPVHGEFRRDDDIIYRLDDFNAEVKAGPNVPDEQKNKWLLEAYPQWEDAVESGAIYPLTNDRGFTYWYVNASKEDGAAYLDAVFDALKRDFDAGVANPWPGFLYEGFDDEEVNTASEDRSDRGYYQAVTDESDGWEAQFIFTPMDNLQIILNYSHVEREVINPGNFVKYDYAEDNWDRWATWYFPNINWGLAGVPVEQVYPGGEGPNLPNRDTSTWTGVGWGTGEALDDTPEDVVSWWVHYSFTEDTPLSGLEIGFGGQWESEREYASAFTSAGQKKENETGVTIKALTESRLTLNAMAKYSWRMRDRYDAYLQVNVDNFLDDKDQYGYFYAPGLSWKVNMGVTF
jgi:outer membrane receptor protein involved in Fe transport